MARFIRDEKRTYPFTWLAIGGIFAASSVWAVYAELVTRVPWQKDQQAFFDMELEQSKQAFTRAEAQWKDEIEPTLKDTYARKAEIEQSMSSGAYAEAKRRLAQLNQEFADAEVGKTFGSSDLDEAYYYRNLAEYDRDEAAVEVRRKYREALAGSTSGAEIEAMVDKIYADPGPPARGDATDKMHHLNVEVARMTAHVAQINTALGDAPPEVRKALLRSREKEQEVIDHLKVELRHQKRVDDAMGAMSRIDGPPEPVLTEKDPQRRLDEQKAAHEKACQGKEDTRNCIIWLKLDPVDREWKALDLEVSKRKRPLVDAELRQQKAESRANPKFDPSNTIASLVGPFQIQQVVLHWIEYDREVDIEQVDRCHTCHMGADSGNYTSAAIPRQFRTHPHRSTLMASHPVESYGCTACHQGQGRATDELAHSGWVLEKKHGKERWHFVGDHYWEEPMLPIGSMNKIVVDERNDEIAVKLGRAKWETIKIDHRNPATALENAESPAHYETEADLFGPLQEKLDALVQADADLAPKWRGVVRKLSNRVQIGLEPKDPSAHIPAKEVPAFGLRFPDTEAAQMFGFKGSQDLTTKQAILTATAPPSVPIRYDGMANVDKAGRYTPPRGEVGLQVPDDSRNRFIQSMPEVESGCLKCHANDVELTPRRSTAKYVTAKLNYQEAEAQKKKDPEGYRKAHDGSDELPAVLPNPAEAENPVPTLSEGRALFRQLNCTGCHILEGFPWDRNAGPALDNLTSKVTPDWILTWIRDPRGWRAKTSMPNLWPKPLDPASKRPLPPGSPEYEKWQAQMREETVAIASYLVEHSDKPETRPGATKDAQPLKPKIQGYADVPGATAERGKKIFEAYGCQGCHSRSDADTADEKLPEPWRSRERDIAPTLSNMGNKTSADWIAYWVEDPSRYWHGTKMPNLRLTREEAASVGKYLASLKSPSPDPEEVDKADVAVVTDPAKRGERVECGVAGNQMLSRVECGERLIGYYGCFGCHQISGFEKSAPIAPELSGFAKKDVTTLDFGYAIADHHLQTTETFATLKLDSPRIYRRDRIELKMGDFDLSPREIRSLVVFLKGLVTARPKTAYNPAAHPEYAAVLTGRQLVEDYNCKGCHLIENNGGDIDAFRQAQLAADGQARAPFLNGEGARVQPEWLFSFLRDPQRNGIRPWLHPEWAYGQSVPDDKYALRMPTFPLSHEEVTAIVRYFAAWDGQDYPYQPPHQNELSEEQKLYSLTHMIAPDAANCLSCHYQGEFPVERGKTELAKLAPDLNKISTRLRPAWVREWLLRPQNYLPYTKMTAFWATTDRPKDSPYWPSESDPFLSPAPAWTKVPNFPAVTSEQQAEMVRDFLFGLPRDAVFPPVGAEATSPLVRNTPVPTGTEAEAASEKDTEKNNRDTKDKNNKKRTGQIGVPARL
ncbi:MAG TPA: cytochrome c [Polyangiaceae bacterium]|nr:cytochrome c [Polyangiaceae bacterium]